MKRVGALTGSAPLSDLARPRGPAIERTAIDAARDEPVPWLLALIPLGFLVMAGLLAAALPARRASATDPINALREE